ncbi:MAG: amino acid transporter [Chloroflexi bacterium]|nr:amino acid transporter [Chloroflexota bacterium]
MPAGEVLAIIDALGNRQVAAWIAGGWAVDALVGEQTRPHRDLDLAIRAEQLDAAIDRLAGLGYRQALDRRPVRLVLEAAGGRAVDLHPVTFDEAGHGRQPGDDGRVFDYPPDAFGEGSIAGVTVRCLTAGQLVRFHLGYEPQAHDRQDMNLLRDRLGIALPDPY